MRWLVTVYTIIFLINRFSLTLMGMVPNDTLIGTIVVFVGILPFCRDDDGLAAVIGHGMVPPHISFPGGISHIIATNRNWTCW
jgi:hypothetical protein